jgi:hypothetical protein
MILVLLNGKVHVLEFREFARLVQDGRIPEDAPVRSDVLTGGELVRAGELRTYAILRGRPAPPPRVIPHDPNGPYLDHTLGRIRWYPSVFLLSDREAS